MLAVVGCLLLLLTSVSGKRRSYSIHDKVNLVANKVGPFNNPTETYPYYSLPFCKPESLKRQRHELGELLSGNRKVDTPYDIRFRVNEEWRELCVKELSPSAVEQFVRAAQEDYYFEMFLDDLPIWGFIGEHQDEDVLMGQAMGSADYIYTHLHFRIGYNDDKIVAVNVTTDPTKRVKLESHSSGMSLPVQFAYSVEWLPSDIPYERRMEVYQQHQFLPAHLEIHWLSIVNSLVLVVLLTAFLSIILMRVVHNEFTSSIRAEDAEDLTEEETGWKLLHGDVFRPPNRLSLFCACVGTGAHLFLMTLIVLGLAVLDVFHVTRRGAIQTALILLYCLTSWVGGYVSARLYKQLSPKQNHSWVWNILLTAVLFPLPLSGTFSFVNTAAVARSSTAALPVGTIALLCALFLVIALPLTIIGGIFGRQVDVFRPPARPSVRPRTIPPVPLYRSGFVQMLLAGFLPFSAISIELHYIFAAVWGHHVYTLFGILLLAFCLLTIVTSFVVVALTYFQLTAEDYKWWWRSFLSGGMVGPFIYAYCFFYFYNHSDMSGLLQSSFFFGYMFNISLGFFLMFGFVGFYSSFYFVRYIYSNIKVD